MSFLGSRNAPTPQICDVCNQLPEPPWIYCQNEVCHRTSLARIVAQTRRSREKRIMKTRAAMPAVRLETQPGAVCPLCRDGIGKTLSSSCSNCKTTYHNDCLLELTNSQCSTIGCNRRISTVEEIIVL